MDDTASKTDQTPGSEDIPDRLFDEMLGRILHGSTFRFHVRQYKRYGEGAIASMPQIEKIRVRAAAWLQEYARLERETLGAARQSTRAAFPIASLEDAARDLEPVPFYGRGFPLQ